MHSDFTQLKQVPEPMFSSLDSHSAGQSLSPEEDECVCKNRDHCRAVIVDLAVLKLGETVHYFSP